MTPPLVCLITPGHVASTPRLVKNAEALAAAGYRVHVVAGRHFPPADALDAEIFASARWTYTLVDYRPSWRSRARQLARRAARRLVQRPGASVAVAARAHQAVAGRLAAAAAQIPAQLFFGHCLAGLPAAAAAAARRGCSYGFDAEDFHDAETEEAAADPAETAARRLLQTRLLPGCALFTTAAPLMAREYARAYGREPLTLLNVFPLSQAPAAPVDPGPIGTGRPARFYWFSQTIGPGRGLEAALETMARMRTPAELRLRGFVSASYGAQLQAHATRLGLARPVVFLPPAGPAEMARLAADSDLGLSIEENRPLNRALCLTNKIFVYLLAGMPQFLSHTPAQAGLAADLGAAAVLGRLEDPAAAARALDDFLSDEGRRRRGRQLAWELARRRYCWELECRGLLRELARVLPGAPAPRA